MSDEDSLSTWQKIIQRRSFTQTVFQELLSQEKTPTELKLLIRRLVTSNIQDGIPREAMRSLVEEQIHLYYNKIPPVIWSLVGSSETLQSNSTREITEEFVRVLAQDSEWQAILRSNKKVFAVDRKKKIVYVPTKEILARKFVGVLFHEIIVHVLRFVQFQIEFKGYRMFEEGLAQSFQMYIFGEPCIYYGRNKVRDLLLLLWELGASQSYLEYIYQIIKKDEKMQHNVPGHVWRKSFFESLDNSSTSKPLQQKYKLYSLGVHKFGRFLKRYNSKSPRTRNIAHKISRVLLQAKFDAMNPNHLRELVRHNIIVLSEEDINYFLGSKIG